MSSDPKLTKYMAELDNNDELFAEIINLYLISDNIRKSALFLEADNENGVYGNAFEKIIDIKNKYFPTVNCCVGNEEIMFYKDNSIKKDIVYALSVYDHESIGKLLGYLTPGIKGDGFIEHSVNGIQILAQTVSNDVPGILDYTNGLTIKIQNSLDNLIKNKFKVTHLVDVVKLKAENLSKFILDAETSSPIDTFEIANLYWNYGYEITADMINGKSWDEFLKLLKKHKIFWYGLALQCKYPLLDPIRKFMNTTRQIVVEFDKTLKKIETEYYENAGSL